MAAEVQLPIPGLGVHHSEAGQVECAFYVPIRTLLRVSAYSRSYLEDIAGFRKSFSDDSRSIAAAK